MSRETIIRIPIAVYDVFSAGLSGFGAVTLPCMQSVRSLGRRVGGKVWPVEDATADRFLCHGGVGY